jgi:hypothetical protein
VGGGDKSPVADRLSKQWPLKNWQLKIDSWLPLVVSCSCYLACLSNITPHHGLHPAGPPHPCWAPWFRAPHTRPPGLPHQQGEHLPLLHPWALPFVLGWDRTVLGKTNS